MFDAHGAFRAAIRAVGMEPPDIIEKGKIYRFPGVNKGPRNRAGWCLLFDDGLGGCFGDWSAGFVRTWFGRRGPLYSYADLGAFPRSVEAARVQADAEHRAREARAADRATTIWNSARPATGSHPYLVRKGIQPYGARLYKGSLMLPVVEIGGKLNSLQFIAANGSKLLLTGGRKRGCFIPVAGSMDAPARVVICEGWATGCTLAEDDQSALVLAAIDAGNLQRVALAVRSRWSPAQIVIAGDDDRQTPGNPGATKAQAAATAADALLALPLWPQDVPDTLTDFNDLAVWLAGGGT